MVPAVAVDVQQAEGQLLLNTEIGSTKTQWTAVVRGENFCEENIDFNNNSNFISWFSRVEFKKFWEQVI